MSDYLLTLPPTVPFDAVKHIVEQLHLETYLQGELKVRMEYDHINFFYHLEGGTRHNSAVSVHLIYEEETKTLRYPSKHPWENLSDAFHFIHKMIFEHIACTLGLESYSQNDRAIPKSEWLLTSLPHHVSLQMYLKQEENAVHGWKKYVTKLKHMIGDNQEPWKDKPSPFGSE